jgi:hypothetical protein
MNLLGHPGVNPGRWFLILHCQLKETLNESIELRKCHNLATVGKNTSKDDIEEEIAMTAW